MARRPANNRRIRIQLGILGLVVGIGAFVLIFVLAPMSTDPGRVGEILGSIGGPAIGIGLVLFNWGLFTKPVNR